MNELKTLGKRTLLVTVCLLLVFSPFYASPSGVKATGQFEPRYGGTLRIAYATDPISWNGVKDYWSTSQYLHRQVYNKLGTYDDLYNIIGDLAVDYPKVYSEPGFPTVHEFELEKGITWQDGAPLTTKDVAFTFETLAWGGVDRDDAPDPSIKDRLALPAYQGQLYLENLKEIEIVDDYVIKFKFSEVQLDLWFINMQADFNVLPEHIWKEYNKNNPAGMTFEDNPMNDAPIGSGPYMVTEHVRDQYVIMDRYDDYFRGIPYLETLIWTFNPDRTASVLALENGEIDTVHEQLNFPEEDINRVNALPDFSVDAFPYTTTWRVTRNYYPDAVEMYPWLTDNEVFKAMEYAIDKDTIVDQVLAGITAPTYTAISWIVAPYGGDYNDPALGYTGDWPINRRTYNPEMAIQTLENAGWSLNAEGIRHKVIDGQDVLLSGFGMPYYHYATSWAEAIAGYWEEVGIYCTPFPVESTSFFEGIEVSETGMNNELGKYSPVGLNTMGGGPDPDHIVGWVQSRGEWGPGWATGQDNFGFYSNERVDELFIEGRQTGVYSERKEIYDELQWNVHEDVGYIFLWNKWKIEAWNNDFSGFGSNRPIAWYGGYFRGDQKASNIERGVYWRGGTTEPFPETMVTTMVTSVTTMVPEFMDLQIVLVAFALFLLAGVFFYRRRRREE